jgi:hypothetical protein
VIGVIGALVVGQLLLLASLLQLSVAASALLVVFAGVPAVLACWALLARASDRRWVPRLVGMFAAGGFGMLLGCKIDFGPLGLYALLGICRSWPSGAFLPSPAQLWLMFTLMPWACIGMLALGTAGMALLDARRRRRVLAVGRVTGFYCICDVGMLLGMAIAEHAVIGLTIGLGQMAAGVVTVVAMLAGMMVGMSALTALAVRVPKIGRVLGTGMD